MTEIEREAGYFYFCDTKKQKGKKLIVITRAKMSQGGKKLNAKEKAFRKNIRAKIKNLKKDIKKLQNSLKIKKKK